jgi:hypothetical protein
LSLKAGLERDLLAVPARTGQLVDRVSRRDELARNRR